jgi:hypothetical protein
MRPAITEVQVFEDGDEQKATVVGPIHLEDPETPFAERDVYLWTRVALNSPHSPRPTGTDAAEETAEGMGAAEMDLEQIETATARAAASAGMAMWSNTVTVEGGRFDVDDRVFVEAWALVRTKNQQREFQIYWYDNDVPVVKGTRPRDSPAE